MKNPVDVPRGLREAVKRYDVEAIKRLVRLAIFRRHIKPLEVGGSL